MIGHVPIPAFLAGAAGMFLLAVNFSYVKRQHILLMLGLGLLVVPGIVANMGDGADMARLKGGVQILYSVAIAYGLFLELRGWGKERVAKLFYVISLLIVAGCFLELYTDFKVWSDSFRSHVLEQGTLYNSDFRDQLVFGKVRPKLFTAEPSYVAIFFLLSMTMWYTLATETLARSWKYFLLALLGMFLIGSPIVLLTAFIPVLNFLFLNEKGRSPFRVAAETGSAKRLLVVLLYSSTLLLVMLEIWHGVEMRNLHTESRPAATESRLELILNGKEDSFTGRLVAPPLIAYRVLSSSPWFGVGLEAKESLNGITLEVFKLLGMQTYHVETSTLGRSVTNVFWLHWIYFGLAGGILMIFWMYKLMRLVGVGYPFYCFLMMVMFMQTMGGYVTPRFWFISFLIMLLGTLQSNSKDGLETLEYASNAKK